MEPPVHSPYAKKYGLDVSLIERLCDDDVYSKGPTLRCKVHLTENHRSHYDVSTGIVYNITWFTWRCIVCYRNVHVHLHIVPSLSGDTCQYLWDGFFLVWELVRFGFLVYYCYACYC